nr:amidohydrolase family protein [Actinomycetes bacterium]
MADRKALHVRGRGLPDGEPVEWWIVDGGLSAEPIADAETVFDGGWIIPGLVDAHCHVGLGPRGPIEMDEAAEQAETERAAGALLLRDAGSPTDTRRFDDRHDLPRIIRAGRHLARPKRYVRGFAVELEDEWQLPDAVAEQARFGDGWVKLVGDWIDRE